MCGEFEVECLQYISKGSENAVRRTSFSQCGGVAFYGCAIPRLRVAAGHKALRSCNSEAPCQVLGQGLALAADFGDGGYFPEVAAGQWPNGEQALRGVPFGVDHP